MIKNKYLSASESFSWSLIDYMLLILASSTIAYEIILFTRLPLWMLSPLFFFWFSILFLFGYQVNTLQISTFKLEKYTISLIILGLLCALINTFTHRPDGDDFSFFHRAVWGLMNLDAPISITHTAHDLTNLPAISPVHLTTSIEVVSTFFANAIGIKPMAFIHNGLGSLCLFIFPFVLHTFFKYLKFSERLSLLGIVITLILYAFSGDSHQDWGNFTLVRAWQGKIILITLFVPLTALLTFKYLRFGDKADLLRLNLAAIASLGLSGSAFFLIPFIVVFSMMGSFFVQYKQINFYKKSIFLITILSSFALVFILIKLGFLPEIKNTDAWHLEMHGLNKDGVRAEIIMLDRTIFVTKTTFYFYLIATAYTLFFYKTNPRILSLIYSSIIICIVLVLPPISGILIKVTLPAAYWRLAYATQMPLIIALSILLAFKNIRKKNLSFVNIFNQKINHSNLKVTTWFLEKINVYKVFALCILLGFVILKNPTINSKVVSSPHQFKFNVNGIAINIIEKWLPLGSIKALIPDELASSIGLIRPDIRMVSTRPLETLHVMLNAGYDRKDIDIRLDGQKDLNTCGKEKKLNVLLDKISNISLLVFPISCPTNEIQNNVNINPANWTIKYTHDYQFWLKN